MKDKEQQRQKKGKTNVRRARVPQGHYTGNGKIMGGIQERGNGRTRSQRRRRGG